MIYKSKSFREFVCQQLNKEIKQTPVNEIKTNGKVWIEELIEKYNELIKEYDYPAR